MKFAFTCLIAGMITIVSGCGPIYPREGAYYPAHQEAGMCSSGCS